MTHNVLSGMLNWLYHTLVVIQVIVGAIGTYFFSEKYADDSMVGLV